MAKSKMLLMVGAVLAVLVLVLCGFMVTREMAALGKTQGALKKLRTNIETLRKTDPYPTSDNVAMQNQNVEVLQKKLDDMMAALQKSNFVVPEGTAAGFVDRLGKLRKELLKMAEASGTRVPDKFAFGFDRWADGASLPDATQLDELNRQLSVATVLCGVLFEEGALEVSKVIREEVAEPVAPVMADGESASTAEAAPVESAPTNRFDRVRFTVEFLAQEPSFFRILNRLAADPMFMVVSSVAMTKDVPDVRMPARPTAKDDDSGKAKEAEVDPTQRIMVSGPSVDGGMRLTLVVDAYHFPGAEPEPTAAATESTPVEER